MKVERRFCIQPVALSQRDDGSEVFSGYAAVYYDGSPGTEYQLWEGAVERVMAGAFDAALKRPDDCRALFNHDPNLLLGRTAAGTCRLRSDTKGLAYECDRGKTTVANDLAEHLKRGDVSGSSFAFAITDQAWRTEAGIDIREIRGVQLYDVSPCTYPAYEGTTAGMRAGEQIEEARTSHRIWKQRENLAKPPAALPLSAILARARAIEIEQQG